MAITEARMSYEEMKQAVNTHWCAECGGVLNIAWVNGGWALRCQDLKHSTITKQRRKSEYELNNEREQRRYELEQKVGTTAVALRRFEGVISLSKEDAKEIITTLWPDAEQASPTEVFKAITICSQYGLNPLMNHLFLIPFKDKDKGAVFSTVLGIGARRLIATRKHSYSYMDYTPRIMTADEEVKVFGAVDKAKVRAITRIKDTKSGAEASGYGEWLKEKHGSNGNYANEPKGLDKGNSMVNMACIRSERAALDRLYPADMPGMNIPVVDETYEKPPQSDVIEGEGRVIESESVETDETIKTNSDEEFANLDRQEETTSDATKSPPPTSKAESTSTTPPPAILANGLNLEEIKQQLDDLQWTDVPKWLSMHFKLPVKKLPEMLAKLDRAQAEEFVKAINERKELK